MNNNDTVTVEFLRDALDWHRMLLSDMIGIVHHGLELQQEMDKKYPAGWMAILYKIGQFGEPEEDRSPACWGEGYDAFWEGKDVHDENPYLYGTSTWGDWNNGWWAAFDDEA